MPCASGIQVEYMVPMAREENMATDWLPGAAGDTNFDGPELPPGSFWLQFINGRHKPGYAKQWIMYGCRSWESCMDCSLFSDSLPAKINWRKRQLMWKIRSTTLSRCQIHCWIWGCWWVYAPAGNYGNRSRFLEFILFAHILFMILLLEKISPESIYIKRYKRGRAAGCV